MESTFIGHVGLVVVNGFETASLRITHGEGPVVA